MKDISHLIKWKLLSEMLKNLDPRSWLTPLVVQKTSLKVLNTSQLRHIMNSLALHFYNTVAAITQKSSRRRRRSLRRFHSKK